MKNKFLLGFAALALLASCSDDEFGTTSAPTSYKVTAKYDDSFENQLAHKVKITITNTNSSEKYEILTNEAGEAVFQNVIPGVYDINATITLNKTEFTSTFGYTPDADEVIFNASIGQTLVNTENTSKEITLKTARLGDLVIKQIYYAGSHTTQGASFRDQFIEIYNNSNEVIYADGLYLGQAYGVLNNTTTEYVQANGQWDWSRSIGMTVGAVANTDYTYCDYIYQIPGTGNQYPIQPGESIVIAQSALNHKSPLVDNDGEAIEVVNPELTIDLSTADFEVNYTAFRADLGLEPFRSDIENPAVPNLNITYVGRPGAYHATTDMVFDNQGRDSFIIFRAENFNFNDYALPNVLTLTSSTKFFVQIPANIVIDGVETQHVSNNIPKRLPETLDISATKVNTAFSTESVIRKTKQIVDGRTILLDTNNSASDFSIIKANPRGFATN